MAEPKAGGRKKVGLTADGFGEPETSPTLQRILSGEIRPASSRPPASSPKRWGPIVGGDPARVSFGNSRPIAFRPRNDFGKQNPCRFDWPKRGTGPTTIQYTGSGHGKSRGRRGKAARGNASKAHALQKLSTPTQRREQKSRRSFAGSTADR